MNPPDDERDPGLDPQIEELLAGYRDFLDEDDPSAKMPDDVTAQIREAIAQETPPAPAPAPRRRNRSMFALAASVTLIGAGLGAGALLTSPGSGTDPMPIRADAGTSDEQATENAIPLPAEDFTIQVPGQPGADVSIVVPANTPSANDLSVVFVLDGKSSRAAASASATCANDEVCVAALIPAFESIDDPTERAATQLEAVDAAKTELSGYNGINDSWLVYGDGDPSDPVIVAGLQRGLFEQLDDLQNLE